MTEAITWSVMKWLREKKRVRKTADQANAALDESRRSIGERWPDPMKSAYEALASQNGGNGAARKAHSPSRDPETVLLAKIKHADEEARRARMDAEQAFDEAERQLSTSLAREGCRKAIHSWDLHEIAIRAAEAVILPKVNA